MGLRAVPLSPSQNGVLPPPTHKYSIHSYGYCRSSSSRVTVISCAKKENNNGEEEAKTKTTRKQSLFESVTEALDFSQVRSARDAELLEEARQATRSGDKMSREQYGALRRKIGGTYKDFFKSYVEDVDTCNLGFGYLTLVNTVSEGCERKEQIPQISQSLYFRRYPNAKLRFQQIRDFEDGEYELQQNHTESSLHKPQKNSVLIFHHRSIEFAVAYYLQHLCFG
ncbi:potassium transporter [Perilla frutescens var. hirtella]|nr:potassium transporter [Perilla frutescens var. hirtella]